MQTSSLAYADTEPVRLFARKRGISPTRVYAWIEEGLIESFVEGKRRHIVLSSYDRMVRRKVAEQDGGKGVKLPSSNPKVKAQHAADASQATDHADPKNPSGGSSPRNRPPSKPRKIERPIGTAPRPQYQTRRSS